MKAIIRLAAFIVMARCVRSFQFLIRREQAFAVGCATSQSSPLFPHQWRLFSSVEADEFEKKRVVFLGTPDVAADALKSIYEDSLRVDSPYEIVGVVTQPPKRRKRGNKVEQSPVGILAEELNLPLLTPEKVGMFLTTDATRKRVLLTPFVGSQIVSSYRQKTMIFWMI